MASRAPQDESAGVAPQKTSTPAEPSADERRRSTAAFSVRTDSDRVIHVYGADRTSSGGSASVRSPASSRGTRSLSSEESWSEIDDDDIEPSDSASRSRHPPPSRRHTVEARPAPTRRHSSRRAVEREDIPPRAPSARSHQSRRESRQESRQESRHDSRHDDRQHSRHARSSSRRVPSDESRSSLADDYPLYGQHGMSQAPYPNSGYRHVPAPTRGGYPPSMSSGYPPDPYGQQDPRQALVSMRHDPFGYPQQHAGNPFAPPSHGPNPFTPMSSDGVSGYFPDTMGPPPPRRHPSDDHYHRRQSYAAPSHYSNEMVAPYHPAYSPWGMHGYPVPGWPHSAGTSPAPRDERSAEMEQLKTLLRQRNEDDGRDKSSKTSEIEALKELIKKHEEERNAREKAWVAEREAEAAARAAEKARAEEEKKRKQEIDDVRKKAKEDAEQKAEEAAKKAKDEHEKKLAEAEKAKADTEKARKELEDEIAKNKPEPDSLKAPIRFKDAVGRTFSFPWHVCKTWKGMEMLIKQAFLHVDMIGDHVHHGHYDLTGPDGEIILPQVWDTMVKPDWAITMHLWPMDEEKKHRGHDDIIDPFANLSLGGGMPAGMMDGFGIMPDPTRKKSKSGKNKDGKKKKTNSPDMANITPAMPPGWGAAGGAYPDPFLGLSGMPPGISVVPEKSKDKTKTRAKSMKSKEISPLAAWFAGGSVSNNKPKKR